MKKIYTIVLASFLSAIVFAQAPQKMNYQAVIRDASNNLVTSHSVGMKISILQGSATGTAVYTETQTPTTNANGLVSIEFGGGTGFSSIDWSTGSYFIQTETDPTGGINYTITGTSQLLSVPYAIYAKTSGSSAKRDSILTSPNGTKYKLLVADDGTIFTVLVTKTDNDGNSYNTVTIGTQTWMSTNLKTTTYNDGTVIPNVSNSTTWLGLSTGALCTYIIPNLYDSTYMINTYGRLYNWYAVNTGKLCPKGWHVPSDSDWTVLSSFLKTNIGGKLKDTTHWSTPNITNESGFTALPGGYRIHEGRFMSFGNCGGWWSSTESDISGAFYRFLNYSNNDIDYDETINNKTYGFSVRCLKD
jgi:uncharacterized protein (TIGR02145 family)